MDLHIWKYTDPTEEACWIRDEEHLESVRSQDPGLLIFGDALPELLEAAEFVLNFLPERRDYVKPIGKLRAAIAKARGG